MTNKISEELLAQAKKHLASSDFENAAKSAKGVLALDAGNAEAADILKAAGAAAGIELQTEPQPKSGLELVQEKIQSAIDSKNFFGAEKMARDYIKEHPSDTEATKLLEGVSEALKNSQLQQRTRQQQRQRDHALDYVMRSPEPESNSDFLTRKILGLISTLVLVLVILMLFVPEIGDAVTCFFSSVDYAGVCD